MRPVEELLPSLGLQIGDTALLRQALTHSSYLHEHRDTASGHNERLEYLGDAVVTLVVSEALYLRHVDEDEGALSARRAAIVNASGLASLARRLDLGSFVQLGAGESRREARNRTTLLAAVFEALVGALYLELGFERVRLWLLELAAGELAADQPLLSLKSAKSRLQELTQRAGGTRPAYRLAEVTGPDHERRFRVDAVLAGRVVGTGEGPSQKVAEAAAAEAALPMVAAEIQAGIIPTASATLTAAVAAPIASAAADHANAAAPE